jgi:hypothetical protein
MAGSNGCSFSKYTEFSAIGSVLKSWGAQFIGTMTITNLPSNKIIKLLIVGLLIVFTMPNVQQIMANYPSALNSEKLFNKSTIFNWRPSLVDVVLIFILGYFVLINLHKQSTFLYFQF